MLYCILFKVANDQDEYLLAANKAVFMQTLRGRTTYNNTGCVFLGDREIMKMQLVKGPEGFQALFCAAQGLIGSSSTDSIGVKSLVVPRQFLDFERLLVKRYPVLIPHVWRLMLPCHVAVPSVNGCLAAFGFAVAATVVSYACYTGVTLPTLGITSKDMLKCTGKLHTILISPEFADSLKHRRRLLREVAAFLTQLDFVHPTTGFSLNSTESTSPVRFVQYVVAALRAIKSCDPFLTAMAVRTNLISKQNDLVDNVNGWSNSNDHFVSYVTEGSIAMLHAATKMPKKKVDRPAAEVAFCRSFGCDSAGQCGEFVYMQHVFYDAVSALVQRRKRITLRHLAQLTSGKAVGTLIAGFDAAVTSFRRGSVDESVFFSKGVGAVMQDYLLEIALICAKMNHLSTKMSTVRNAASICANEVKTPVEVDASAGGAADDCEVGLSLRLEWIDDPQNACDGLQLLADVALPPGTGELPPLPAFVDDPNSALMLEFDNDILAAFGC
jgi:hypothetical protein